MRKTFREKTTMTQGRGLVTWFCLTLVLQGGLAWSSLGNLNLDGLKEALMSLLLEIRVDNSTLWTNTTLRAPQTNLSYKEIERALLLSISHISQRTNTTIDSTNLEQYIHSYVDSLRLADIEDERRKEEQDYKNGGIEIYVMTAPKTTSTDTDTDTPKNPSPGGSPHARTPPTLSRVPNATGLIASGVALILLALAVVAPMGAIIGLKYARPKGRVLDALVRIAMVMSFFLLIGIMLLCSGVSHHASAQSSSPTPHRPKRSVRYKTATTPLWVRTQSNSWWKWANYTVKKHTPDACMVCAEAEHLFTVTANPNNYVNCVFQTRDWLARNKTLRCPVQCMENMGSGMRNDSYNPLCLRYNLRLSHTSPSIDSRKLQLATGIYECYRVVNGKTQLGTFPGQCALTWTCDATDTHSRPTVSITHTQVSLIAAAHLGLSVTNYTAAFTLTPFCRNIVHATERVADMFWMCGTGIFSRLPSNWTGTCARVLLSHPVVMGFPSSSSDNSRRKRQYDSDPDVFIDVIGQPRGIPNQFKARNEILAGVESNIPWRTVNKNVEWINYIYYNQQRFINYTDDALSALGEQLRATSKMTRQNRWVLDWILAEKGGVCVLFGKDCCTIIPNNTSPEGTFTNAMDRLKTLRNEVTANAGFEHEVGDWLERVMGRWGSWLAKAGLLVGVTLIIVILLLSCFLPLLRSSLNRAIGIQLVSYKVNAPLERQVQVHQLGRRDTPHYQSPRDPLPRVPSRSQYENLPQDRLGPPKDLDDAVSDQAYESSC